MGVEQGPQEEKARDILVKPTKIERPLRPKILSEEAAAEVAEFALHDYNKKQKRKAFNWRKATLDQVAEFVLRNYNKKHVFILSTEAIEPKILSEEAAAEVAEFALHDYNKKQVYGNEGWVVIEEAAYTLLIDTLLEEPVVCTN
ncbi:hypothetical protein PHJA_002845700 [Phtheirospermum japonicum]|uniref:Uncharacterized protein n=1 Tax=Phtheirospermum japonicum TaxID=374723 RepID=A0A830DJR4_9LAMI|nr:hypothetical protein PHJA_002845700 [Phtheirospermum japonicum]